jgi:hypothetical protein
MANALSNYLENKLVDHILRATPYPMPAMVCVALFVATPSDAGGGTEVSGGSYARVAVGPSTSAWTATQGGTAGASSGTNGTSANAADVPFPSPTANWGLVSHFGIFDAITGGNLLFWAALTPAQTVNGGDAAPKFLAGALTVTFD